MRSLREFLGSRGFVVWCLLIIVGIFLRWYDLSGRPLHHDESIHAMFGKYFYDFPEQNFYKYNPEYHGPTLYLVLRATYNTIGAISDGEPRAPIALLGSLMLLAPILFRQFFHPWTFLFLTAFTALSPTLIYWSRFCREDFFVLTGMFMVLWGVVKADPSRKAFWVMCGIALNWGTKANVYVFMAQVLGYLIYEGMVFAVKRPADVRSSLSRLAGYLFHNPASFIIGFIASAGLYSYIITTAFRNLDGILDGLYRKSIVYWLDKHSIERIAGPFNFHFYQLSWYELLFIILFIGHVVIFYTRKGLALRLWGLGMLIISGALFFHYSQVALPEGGGFLKLKDRFDAAGAVILLLHPLAVTTYYLAQGNRLLGFWGYFFTANFFTYSYLGEKVPWLSTYILIPGIIFLALFYQDFFRVRFEDGEKSAEIEGRTLLGWASFLSLIVGGLLWLEDRSSFDQELPFFIFGFFGGLYAYLDVLIKLLPKLHLGRVALAFSVLFLLRMAWLTSFVHQERELGFIAQVHTTREFKAKLEDIRQMSETARIGRKLQIHVSGEPVWPATWYFRDMPEYQYQEITAADYPKYDVILKTFAENEAVPEGFVAQKINLRGWWVPDYTQMTFKRYLNMAINLRAWSPNGFSPATILINKKILPAMAN